MSDYEMRDTDYATETAQPAVVDFGDNHEGRMERIYIKAQDQEEVRFSWWKNGKMMQRPLDLPHSDLLALLEKGFGTVLHDEFLVDLRARIDAHLTKRLLESQKRLLESQRR